MESTQDLSLIQFCKELNIDPFTEKELKSLEDQFTSGIIYNNVVYKRLKTNTKYKEYPNYLFGLKSLISEIDEIASDEYLVTTLLEGKNIWPAELQKGLDAGIISPEIFICDKHDLFDFMFAVAQIICERYKIGKVVCERHIMVKIQVYKKDSTSFSFSVNVQNYAPDNGQNYIEHAIENKVSLPEITELNVLKERFDELLSLYDTKYIEQELHGCMKKNEEKLIECGHIAICSHSLKLSGNNMVNLLLKKYARERFTDYKIYIMKNKDVFENIYTDLDELHFDIHLDDGNLSIYYTLVENMKR